MTMLPRALVVWLVLMVLAILNGTLRQFLLVPWLGDQTGHVISTILLSGLIFLTALLTLGWIGPANLREAMVIGVVWLLMTLAFEFLAGHYLFGSSWEKILAEYNLLRGRIWPLVLLATVLAPAWAFWQRRGR